jgi:CBS domain-containing protein
MMELGSDAEPITRLVSSLNDSIAVRAIELAARDFALPDVPWAWIALGSEGREEQTLATDQDNGIVFEAAEPGPVRDAFVPFAQRVNVLLDAAGFALCKGEIMAGNPRWCLSSQEWRDRFATWIDVPEPQALLHAAIFFDFRAVHGDATLVARLRGWLAEHVAGNDRFLLLMAHNALQNQPPLGLIRDFVLTGTGEHKGKLDLKVNGVQLFVEAARIYALANGVDVCNTIGRLRASGERARIPAVEIEAWVDAFRFLQTLRLRLNVEQVHGSAALHNFLAPTTLNELDRTVLRESMRQARRLQARLTRDYGGGARSLA